MVGSGSRRLAVFGIFSLLLLSGCGLTPAAHIVDDCIVGPNSSCVASDLNRVDLVGRDVKGTDFTLADLRDADLRDANFAGANLFQADLTGAVVTGANFASANMIGTTCPSGKLAKGSPASCPDLPVKPSGKSP